MILGVTLMKLDGTGYYTPQFNRNGLSAVFSCNVLNLLLASGISLDVDVQHKDADDTSFSTLASFSTITTLGVKTLFVTGIKEQVRLKFTVGGSNAYDAVHVSLLAPQWFAY